MLRDIDGTVDFILTSRPPESARRMAALLLVDTLGVAAGAHPMTPSRIAREMAVETFGAGGAAEGAPMLFDGRRVSIPGAAFAAATGIDNLDGHDGYNPTKGHIGCAVAPALIAFASRRPDLGSRDALDIMVMAYEIGARAAIALHRSVSDYHTSGAWNALAVAALGCRLLGADRSMLREALGIAEYHGPRSQMMREIAHPTMLHDGSGMGALTGAMAVLLAAKGFDGAPAITVESEEVADIWADLGTRWTIEENYIKPYPVCRWAHAPLDALRGLMRDRGLAAQDIARIEVRTFAESAALFPGQPQTTSEAQYSLRFALAAMLARGHVGPGEISGNGLFDPEVTGQLDRIEIAEDRRHSSLFPAHRRADLTLTLTDGAKLHSGDVEARGGPDAPLSDSEIEAKLMLFAEPVIGTARSQAIWKMREALFDDDHRFASLVDLVTAPA